VVDKGVVLVSQQVTGTPEPSARMSSDPKLLKATNRTITSAPKSSVTNSLAFARSERSILHLR